MIFLTLLIYYFSITVVVESDIFLVLYYNSFTYFRDSFQSVPNPYQHYLISDPASNYYNSRFQPSVREKQKSEKITLRVQVRYLSLMLYVKSNLSKVKSKDTRMDLEEWEAYKNPGALIDCWPFEGQRIVEVTILEGIIFREKNA